MNELEQIIQEQESKLESSKSHSEIINILYNLIFLKNNQSNTTDNYKDIKRFILHYVDHIESANFGYDNFNYNKIDKLLNLINFEQQVSVLQFAISSIARELPEFESKWFLKRKHEAEINNIFFKKKRWHYPKAILLYLGLTLQRLLLALLCFVTITYVFLLPAPFKSFELFSIKYETYAQIFPLNHLLNIITYFADLDSDFKITPLNWAGIFLIVIGKILFVVLIVNFIYIKISDKIKLK